VQKGETLYSIAWGYGLDYKDVARWNGIYPPFTIFPGQALNLATRKSGAQPAPTAKSGQQEITRPRPTESKEISEPAANKTGEITRQSSPVPAPLPAGNPAWQWPTRGRLLRDNSPTSEKGVNISGKHGQEIKAAANGEVVYSGSGLLGYGKLIIIKHNEIYLSAYAHNSHIFVKEGERVAVGQKIATMGLVSNGKPVLHFEIRKNGKPVDPLKFLPANRK